MECGHLNSIQLDSVNQCNVIMNRFLSFCSSFLLYRILNISLCIENNDTMHTNKSCHLSNDYCYTCTICIEFNWFLCRYDAKYSPKCANTKLKTVKNSGIIFVLQGIMRAKIRPLTIKQNICSTTR